MTKRLLALFALSSLLATTSCIDEVLAPADESVGNIEIVSGNNQSGRLAGQLVDPLVVKVTTKAGQPVTGATVTFDPDTGSGTVSSTTALSDAEGLARVNWTLGASFGTKTLVAKAGDGRKISFTATAVPDRLELSSGNNQIGRASKELSGPVVVKVLDLAGRPAAGVAVTFAPETGSGSVVPSLVATESDGTARAVWTLGATPGPKVLRVTAATATSPVTVNATATQDILTVVSGGNQAIVAGATLTAPVVVQMKDQTGAIVAGAQLTFTPTAGSGAVSPASVFTDSQGRAQTTWTLGSTPGTKALQVTGGSAVALTVNASALSTDSVQVVSGNAQAGRAGAVLPSPVVVRVLDANGRAVQGAAVRFAASAGNGSPTTQVDTTDAQGLAETNWVLGSTLGEMRLTATVGAASPVTISATTTQDRLTLVSGGLQFGRVGTALAAPVVVKLVDLSGKAVPGVVLTFTPDSANGTVLPTTVSTDSNGEARTSWTVGASAGPMTLRVSTITAPTLIVNATAIEGQLSLVSGGEQAALAGTALTQPIVVRVQDQTGTPLQGSLVTFTVTTANGTVSPTSIFSDAQGLARTTWTLGATPGAKTLTITGGSSTLTVGATALTGDSLEIVSGNAQAAQSEQPLTAPLVVRVRDTSSGRVVSGAIVTFTPTTGSGTVGAGTVVSDGAGLAQTTWTLGSGVGEKRVTAAVGGATVSFRATATQDRLELVSGGAQTARPGTALTNPVVVRLFDINNRAMAGVEVDFTPDANNGTTLPSRIVTGSDGTARTVWTIGPNPGVMRLTVRAGTAAPILVYATGGRDEIQLVSGGGQVGRVTRILPDSIAVRVLDPAGVPSGGVTVTFAAGDAQSGTPSPATVTTNAQGIARTGWILGALPGPMTLTANALNANPAVATAIATQDLLELVSGGDQVRAVGGTLAAPVVVRLRNQAGDSLVNEVVTFTAAAGSGTVGQTSVLTDLEGLARTTWTLGSTAGAQTLTVRGGVATAVTVSATARQTDSLAIVSGDAQAAQAGTALANPIVMRVNEKSSGRAVPGATVTFTITAANGSVSETSVVSDANGLARTNWTLGATTGAKSLTVSVGTPAVTRTVTATATIERLEVVSGGNQTGRRDSTLANPIVVRVVDLANQPVPNVLVRFTPATGNGTVLPDAVATDATGVARTAWTLGNVGGTQSLVVNAGAAGTLTVFATASQSRLVLESGGGQSARIQSALTDSIVVKALTPDSLPLPNLAVTFGATSGTVSPVTVTTNAQGLAKVRWTMGNAAGAATLTASATGVISVSAQATALADARRILTLEAGNLQTDTVESFLTSVIRVKVTDSLNNPIAGETILWTDSLTNGVLPVFTTSQTNALGLAETSVKLGVGVGSSLLRARLGGRSETVTATMTSQIPFAGIQTGNLFSCALTSEGRSYCWGFNGDGQLAKQSGVTANTARPTTPVTPTDSLRGPFQTFRSLSLGRTHACGISATKRLVCWGTGSGTFGATAATGVTFTPAVTVESVAAGEAHTCFIDIDGFAWCGGENRLGQLGNRSTTATTGNSAVGVVDGTGAALRFSSVASGRSFSCGFARGASLPRCWGDNGVGQLGRASVISHDSVAVTVSSAVVFDTTSLVTGLQHACALSTAGAAFCWGGNGFGQLGDASTTNRNAPTAVAGGLTFVRLAAGEYHSCGLTVSGAAFCWGNNASGQLGDGTIVAKNTPTAVTLPAGVTGFRAITLGELHSCAITGVPTAVGSGTTTGTGTVYCWGDNEYGQLGNNTAAGNNAPVLTPTRVVNQP